MAATPVSMDPAFGDKVRSRAQACPFHRSASVFSTPVVPTAQAVPSGATAEP